MPEMQKSLISGLQKLRDYYAVIPNGETSWDWQKIPAEPTSKKDALLASQVFSSVIF
jgi:hypothetical protein